MLILLQAKRRRPENIYNIEVINAKRGCIASNRNGKCEHGVVVTCQGDSRSPSSTAAFVSALHLVV